jgi:hypothetical protein
MIMQQKPALDLVYVQNVLKNIHLNSACPIIQEKRRAFVELLVFAEQQHQYDFQENDYPALKNDNPMYSSSHIPRQSADPTQRSFR